MAKFKKTISDLASTREENDSVLVVSPSKDELEEDISVMYSDQAIGRNSVAFIVFGVPGTDTYTILDLNELPENYSVRVLVSNNQTSETLSDSLWTGSTGNSPQPLVPPE